MSDKADRSARPCGGFGSFVEETYFHCSREAGLVAQLTEGRKLGPPVDGYLDEGFPRRQIGLLKGRHQAKSDPCKKNLQSNMLVRDLGFLRIHGREWVRPRRQIAGHKPSWADERTAPPFLLVAAQHR